MNSYVLRKKNFVNFNLNELVVKKENANSVKLKVGVRFRLANVGSGFGSDIVHFL